MIRFVICNIFIAAIIGLLSIAKGLLKQRLTNRMNYHLWFLFFALLVVPFLPVKPPALLSYFPWIGRFTGGVSSASARGNTANTITASHTTDWMNDFTISVNRTASPLLNQILFFIWMVGILIMMALLIKSLLNLNTVKKSALPLENKDICKLYHRCLAEMSIKTMIPICSTTFFKSPVIVGLFRPCIYLPLHVIADYRPDHIRYMLLHELQHYKHKDAFADYLMSLARIVYWFNPLIWYALKEMRNDREIACDTAVLEMLDEQSHVDYGNTLIDFAEKLSVTTIPFAAGISGNANQIRQRIHNIATYEKPSMQQQIKSILIFSMIATLLITLAPSLSTYAFDEDQYQLDSSAKNTSYTDFSSYFGEYEGSFVLYDLEEDSWNIYNKKGAATRVSPNSTYKIYNALFAMEEGIITPTNSLINWNGQPYPFDTWNKDQDLTLAMQSSVNWYFHSLDKKLGAHTISKYIQKVGYGNKKMSDDLSSYWMESSLKISPIEQVSLLKDMYTNTFDFAPEHINAVKDAIHLSSSETGKFYGKTGTGRVNNQDVNGWFIGYTETTTGTYFFASNIHADSNATGNNATKIALSILADLQIWEH